MTSSESQDMTATTGQHAWKTKRWSDGAGPSQCVRWEGS